MLLHMLLHMAEHICDCPKCSETDVLILNNELCNGDWGVRTNREIHTMYKESLIRKANKLRWLGHEETAEECSQNKPAYMQETEGTKP